MRGESAPHVLAIDHGTTGVRVALVTLRGEVLGWESEPVPLHLTPDGGAEQSPAEWWQAFVVAAKRLLGRGLAPPRSVRALACSTQGEGTVPVDASGEPLMRCILWMDMRGAPHLEARWKRTVNVAGAAPLQVLRWIRLTGGMPSMTGKDPAGHMLLIREAFPHVYERTHKFLNVLDWWNLRLTGRFVATFDSILTSWVTDNRDPNAIRYHEGLVRSSGIAREKLPDIVPCTEVLGPLLPEVAETLGLGDGVSVIAGAIDNTAAAIGSGAVDDYFPHLYVGTSSWLGAHVPFKKTDVATSLASVPCALPDRYLLTALQASAGANLLFARDNLFCRPDALTPDANPEGAFAAMDRLAAEVPAGARGVVYTPWVWGERAPVDDRSLRGSIVNLSLHNDRADVLRAVLEGVAMNTRWLVRPVEKFLGRSVGTLRFVGGGASSELWCQIFADVLDVEIQRPDAPSQANARGAALIAAAGLGEVTLRDAAQLVPSRRSFTPDPKHRALYDERFEVFVSLYRSLRGLHRRLNGDVLPPSAQSAHDERRAHALELRIAGKDSEK